MIYHTRTRIFKSLERQVSANSNALYEGMALTAINDSGVGTVRDSQGSSNEVFAGIALNYFTRPTTTLVVETVTVPASGAYTVTLGYTPLSPTTGVAITTANGGTALAYNASVGSGQFSISGAVVTFNSAQAGNTYTVLYRRNLSVQESIMIQGDSVTLGAMGSSDRTGTIGCLLAGEIWTDSIDPSVNWLAANPYNISTGAGGVLTIGGSAPAIKARILAAPTASVPFLGLEIAH